MKFYFRNKVEKARFLRKKGLSAKEIGRKLGVGNTTILRWCVDIPSDNPTHLLYQQGRAEMKKEGAGSVSKFKLTPEMAKSFASMLYWCEGHRYPSSNFIGFANSDPLIVKTFLELFRKGFHPKEDKLRAHLQLHTTHDKDKITAFWSKLLKIPKIQFYKPTVTIPTGRMKRYDYKGTCTIRYHNISFLFKIMGIYEELARKILIKK